MREKDSLGNGFLSCEELLNVLSTEGTFDGGFGLAIMKGSHLVVKGRFGEKRSLISIFVSALTCLCPLPE